ncbi:hypothetical protein [Luteimonas abyssi]|uniref:hypothetical protein n=1 Tax=Luteimonas abyssi TaxID=1247514 RepID=UPI000737B80A|nr:hypothetical protein [Luteimonas abyssi]
MTLALLFLGAALAPPALPASSQRSSLGIGLTILPACRGHETAAATAATTAASIGPKVAPTCGARLERQPREAALPAPPPASDATRAPDILLIEF